MSDEPQYGAAIHPLLRASAAQLADASATLLSHRLRGTVLLVGAGLFIALSPHRPVPDALALLWALAAGAAALPLAVQSGIDVDDFYRQYGAASAEDAAAQLVTQSWGAYADHARRCAWASHLCTLAVVLAVAAMLSAAL